MPERILEKARRKIIRRIPTDKAEGSGVFKRMEIENMDRDTWIKAICW